MFEQFIGRSLIKFTETFTDSEKCKKYLAEVKWSNGFNCSSCGHTHHWEGVKPYTKVCKNCRYIESVTANTLFHKIKFDLRKAFLILFEMSTSTKSCSSTVMAAKYDINQKTAWLFMSKIRQAMASSQSSPIQGSCEVDECFVGGSEPGKIGRAADKKKTVAIVVNKAGETGIKRAYAIKINNCSSKELKRLFDGHISPQAEVVTDKWRGYEPLCKDYIIKQEKSIPQENFQVVHRFIQGLKSWLRGIHHHVSDNFLQGYLNEYCYRFNRNQIKPKIFHLLVERMVTANPVTYANLYNT